MVLWRRPTRVFKLHNQPQLVVLIPTKYILRHFAAPQTASMPLFWLSISFLTGILLTALLSLHLLAWLALAGLASLFAIFSHQLKIFVLHYWGRSLSRMIGFLPFWCVRGLVCLQIGFSRLVLPAGWLVVALCLGGARYQAALPQISPTDLAYYNDAPESVVLDGWLLEPADLRDQYSLLRLHVDQLRLPERDQVLAMDGQLLVRTAPGVPWQYGDRLRLDGWLVNAPEQEDFSYRQYLARQGIYSYMTTNSILRIGVGEGNSLIAAAYQMRQRALDLVYQYWPDPEASLLAGILLGVETGIPTDVAAAFRDTGTAHIIAISG